MDSKTAYLGVDVSKGYADFLLLGGNRKVLERSFQLDDTRKGHLILTDKLREFFEIHGLDRIYAGVESTGGYENNWLSLMNGLGGTLNLKASRLNPFPVKSHRDAGMSRNVTDAISAQAIASYMIAHPDEARYEPKEPGPMDSMRRVYKLIKMLQKQTTQLLNQLEKLVYVAFPEALKYCRRSFPQWMLHLLMKYPTASCLSRAKINGMIKVRNVDEQKARTLRDKAKESVASQTDATIGELIRTTIAEIIRRKEVIAEQKKLMQQCAVTREIQLLQSIKGVGVFSAACLLIEIEDINRFSSAKKLASFFGLHPVYKISGDGKSAFRMSKKGRAAPRGILYLCALSAIGFDDHLKKIYARHRARGKNHHQAIGIVMHKMLRIIYGILKSGKPYDPEIDKGNMHRSKSKKKERRKASSVRRFQEPDEDAPISQRHNKTRNANTDMKTKHPT